MELICCIACELLLLFHPLIFFTFTQFPPIFFSTLWYFIPPFPSFFFFFNHFVPLTFKTSSSVPNKKIIFPPSLTHISPLTYEHFSAPFSHYNPFLSFQNNSLFQFFTQPFSQLLYYQFLIHSSRCLCSQAVRKQEIYNIMWHPRSTISFIVCLFNCSCFIL